MTTSSMKNPGTSSYSFRTNEAPKGGSCTVFPLSGEIIFTNFRITCSGFTDEDTPIFYTLYAGLTAKGI